MARNTATFVVDKEVSLEQGSLVRLDGGKLVAATAATHDAIGVIEDGTTGDYAEDQLRSVAIAGICQMRVNGDGTAIEAGDLLMPGAGGKAVKVNPSASHVEMARALEGSEADGDLIYVLKFSRNHAVTV